MLIPQEHLCRSHVQQMHGSLRAMSDAQQTAAKIRVWMQGILDETGLKPSAWAKKAGLAGTTVTRAIKPDYEFVTSSTTLAKLAAAVNREAPDTRSGRGPRSAAVFLPVRFKVQAGLWYETDHFGPESKGPNRPVSPDPRYSAWPQWLEEVVGDSMNLLIPPGSFVHVVDAIEMGYTASEGDLVVVERRRDGGLLRERTIKQVARKNGRVELWPRSTNPSWQDPLKLAGDGEVEVEVVGRVIGFYQSFV